MVHQSIYEKDLDTIEELITRNGFNVVVQMMERIAIEKDYEDIANIMNKTVSNIALGTKQYE